MPRGPPPRMPRGPAPGMPPAPPPRMLAPANPSDVEDYVRRASSPLSTNAESYLLQPQPTMPRSPPPRMPRGPAPRMPRGPAPRMPRGSALRMPRGSALRMPRGPASRMPRGPASRMPRGPAPWMPPAPPPRMLAPAKPSNAEVNVRRAFDRILAQAMERIDLMFNTYANKSLGLIDPEGIERLCANVFQVDHTDVRLLMLAWKMKAKKPGFFTIEEWRQGLIALQAGSISMLKKGFNEIEKEVADPKAFADFYSYAFQHCLTENMQKSLDIESTCDLLNIVLGPKYPDQVQSFVEYLQVQKDYRVITRDQWKEFLHFCNEVHFPSLDNYDPSLAWPIILDNFVDWLGEKQR